MTDQSSESPVSKADRTRSALLDAAMEIAASRGAEAVTTTSVAKACGVAVGTFYRYYADRVAVLEAAFDRVSETLHARWFERLGDLQETSPLEAGRHMMDAHAALLDEIPSYVPLLEAVRGTRPAAAQDKKRDDRGRADEFARRLGVPLTPSNHVRLDVLRAVTGTLTVLYALADGDERQRLHEEVVRIAAQSLAAMRSETA